MNDTLMARARVLDAADPLAPWRAAFDLPAGCAYFDGNSLGPPSRAVLARLREVGELQWRGQLVTAWNQSGWIDWPLRVGAKIAPLLGAAPDQVVVADSTSINLFKALAAAADLRPQRQRILIQDDLFPSDLYLAQALAEHQAGRLRVDARPVACLADPHDPVWEGQDAEVAVLCLGHVDFRRGELYDLAQITAVAHHHGALVVWDLSHSVGALPIELDRAEVDFAVGCGYKFLNGGPGAPAFLYVALRHQDAARNPLPGWLGHHQPFAFAPSYEPAVGVARFQCGTPPILSLAALDAALDLWAEVDLAAIRQKSLALFDFFCEGLAGRTDLEIATPRDPTRRGSQLTVRHPEARALANYLIAHQIVPDFRAPDLLRFGLAPLYQRFADVAQAVNALHQTLDQGLHRAATYQANAKVT